jgi:hypothetical protein
VKIVLRAVEEPSVIVNDVTACQGSYGYDASNETYGDMVVMGIEFLTYFKIHKSIYSLSFQLRRKSGGFIQIWLLAAYPALRGLCSGPDFRLSGNDVYSTTLLI